MDSTRTIRLLVRQNDNSIRDIILGTDINTVSGCSDQISKDQMLDLLSAFNLVAPKGKDGLKRLSDALRRDEGVSEIRSTPKWQSFCFMPDRQFAGSLLVNLSVRKLWDRISSAQDSYRNPVIVDLTDVTGHEAFKSALTRIVTTLDA